MNAARESSNNQSQSQSSQPTSTSQSTPTAHKQTTPPPTSTIQATQSRSSPAPQPTSTPQTDRHSTSSSDFLRHQPPPPAFRAPPEFHSPFFPNGNGLFRPGFPPTYQHPAHHHPTVLSHSPITQSSVQNGEYWFFYLILALLTKIKIAKNNIPCDYCEDKNHLIWH